MKFRASVSASTSDCNTRNAAHRSTWAISKSGSDGYGNERSYLHYLDIPIHLRFKYSNLNGFERKLCPFVFVGPELSILLAHNKLEKNGEAAFDYKPVQLGLAVGVGVEIRRNWQLTGSYTWDMTGTMNATKLDNFDSHNRTWKVALTYFF